MKEDRQNLSSLLAEVRTQAIDTGINEEGLTELEQKAPRANTEGFVVIRNFINRPLGEVVIDSLTPGTQKTEVIAKNKSVKFLVDIIFNSLVLTSRSAINSNLESPDVFLTSTDGITSHRDYDRINTALLNVKSSYRGVSYHFFREHYIAHSHRNIQSIPRHKARLDNEAANNYEFGKFPEVNVSIFTGDLIIIGAHAIKAGKDRYLSPIHAAETEPSSRLSLGIFKK